MENSPESNVLATRSRNISAIHLRSGHDGEAFLVASVMPGQPTVAAARDAYERIASHLLDARLEIVQERIFASRSVSRELLETRAAVLRAAGVPDDGAYTYIEGHPTCGEGMAGVIVRGVPRGSTEALRSLRDGKGPCGRAWEKHGATFLMLQGIHGLEPGPGAVNTRSAQTRRIIERAERLLAEQGATFRHVTRTWFYLSRILDWYEAFNRVRSEKYRTLRIMPEPGSPEMLLPASTGISGENLHGAAAVLDLLAVVTENGADVSVRQMTNPRQMDAVRYGSAFSRGALIRASGLGTVQVSGTAAIDDQGRSLYPEDVRSQIACTLDTIEALLEPVGCGLREIVAATVFVKHPQDGPVFREMAVRRGLEPFPAVTVVADICRSELLFEIDAEAVCRGLPEGSGT